MGRIGAVYFLLSCCWLLATAQAQCGTAKVTLASLRNGGQGYKTPVQPDGHTYVSSICEPLDSWVCGYGVGFCETWPNGNRWIGKADGTTITPLPDGREGASISYFNGDFDAVCGKTWSGRVNWVCDAANIYSPRFETPVKRDCQLNLTAHHCSACEAGCNYDGFTSQLPIIKIDTKGGALQWWDYKERPKILSWMKVMWGGEGVLNRFDEKSPIHYDAEATCNVRGQTSVYNSKKSISVKTCMPSPVNNTGDACSRAEGPGNGYFTTNKVEYLGMPAESSWVFYAPFGDKPMMRNTLSFNITNQMGRYASRTRQVELFLKMPPYPPREGVSSWKPGEPTYWQYVGLYNVQESVKRGKDRVNIKKISNTDNTPPAVTGGYLLAMDKLRAYELNITYWFMTPSNVRVIVNDPGFGDITPQQGAYLKQYFTDMEAALMRSYDEAVTYIDAMSFIDYFLVMEFTKNVDGWRWNNFMTKDRSAKLVMGPIWDMDLGWWNANFFDCQLVPGWQYYYKGYDQKPPFWFGKLAESAIFRNMVIARWRSLRGNVWSTDRMMEIIDDKVKIMGRATGIARNYLEWPVLDLQLWPNPPPFNGTYEVHVQRMKNFIAARAAWIDENIVNVAPPPSWSEEVNEMMANSSIGHKHMSLCLHKVSMLFVITAAIAVFALVARRVQMRRARALRGYAPQANKEKEVELVSA